MIKLLLRKCLQGLMMIMIVSAVTFALLGFAGGDALTQLQDNPQISKETIERLRSVYHFRYGTFAGFPARSPETWASRRTFVSL
jgi:ABC-type dipeptide/oligopeptide/nickel transport system permease component